MDFALNGERQTAEIIYSNRKTLALEVHRGGRCVVRAPFFVTEKEIGRFVAAKADWIKRKLVAVRKKEEIEKSRLQEKLTTEELSKLKESAAEMLAARVAFFAPIVGVTVGKITVRRQVSRWGSCSAKGNLNFNCLLALCPESVLDYVVVHELCHRKEMNHSPRFWKEVKRILPAFEVERRWLREHGGGLIGRLPE